MNRSILIFCICIIYSAFASAQVTGYWQATDEKTNEVHSIVEIFEDGNKYYGRIDRLLPNSKYKHCIECQGDLKGKPLKGILILYDLLKTTNGGTDGKILDPVTGNVYDCDIELIGPDRLKLRGYFGFSVFGKTFYWNRLK